MADRDGHSSRGHPHGDRDREKPRERRRDAQDGDRERLRDKARGQDVEKHQSRGKDLERERDRERDRELHARWEEPRLATTHHNLLGLDTRRLPPDLPKHRMRSGTCLGLCGSCPTACHMGHAPLKRLLPAVLSLGFQVAQLCSELCAGRTVRVAQWFPRLYLKLI